MHRLNSTIFGKRKLVITHIQMLPDIIDTFAQCSSKLQNMLGVVTFHDLTLLDIANLCPAVLIMNFLFV